MQLLIILGAILLQVFLTVKKVNPFISLLIVAILAGLALGMPAPALLKSIEKGVGSTLGGLALILCLGAVLGKILEASGAAEKIAITLIKKFGEQNIQWAVLLTGFLIGIPLYYNAGFVILVPLVFMLARKTGLPLLYIAIPMAASLSTTHCFLPPHPGPVVLVNAFKADMGTVLMYGILIAIPAVIVAGPFLGRLVKGISSSDVNLFSSAETEIKELPSALPSFLIALLPVLLISLAVVAQNFLTDGFLKTACLFIGDSTIALLIAVLLAFYVFGVRKKISMDKQMKWLNDGISGIAMILLIITAGGVFKQVLQDSGTGDYIASFSSKWQMPPLIFAWVITALLRVTIGSATVAGITAAGIVAPLVTSGAASPELMVLAVGSGSVFGSHINDSGFWMYKEFFKLSLKQTFLSWTVMETAISIIGLAGVLVLNSFR
ncbi:Gnt-I system high-affinity gluconate transporter [Lacibacter cauensis]|uniref:Gnt-I system high-affinity gluconate transporter n=1 Tax=Lacibacter cauensis TaxID=510947 RepID=A0A562SWC3_9BACT|nr:gluconate:H+ symporter [Lacibacter cauensis]TWI85585.1 Gnt-I system high-affinity gluconate transporter [Lacibacter cauensis]